MEHLKKAAKTAGFVALSYAIGAVLFVGFVVTSIAVEQHDLAKRLRS